MTIINWTNFVQRIADSSSSADSSIQIVVNNNENNFVN